MVDDPGRPSLRWPQMADQFTEHAMPCERCGELVRTASTEVEATTRFWAEGRIRFFCEVCWEATSE